MPGNFSSIGFACEPDEQFHARVEDLANTTRERLAVAQGDYVIWRSHSGAELWFHVPGQRLLDGELEADGIIGVTAYFEGSSAARFRLERVIRRGEDNPFEGAFAGWVTDAEGGTAAEVALAFDAIDFAAHDTRSMPLICSVKLVGFVRTLLSFTDEVDFRAGGGETKGMEPRSLFASGLRAAGAKGRTLASAAAPSAHAIVNGVVRDHRRLHNEATDRDFHVVTVESEGMTLDLVAAARHVEGALRPGVVVSAMCSLVGRILEDH
jgi:hypothetical protein